MHVRDRPRRRCPDATAKRSLLHIVARPPERATRKRRAPRSPRSPRRRPEPGAHPAGPRRASPDSLPQHQDQHKPADGATPHDFRFPHTPPRHVSELIDATKCLISVWSRIDRALRHACNRGPLTRLISVPDTREIGMVPLPMTGRAGEHHRAATRTRPSCDPGVACTKHVTL